MSNETKLIRFDWAMKSLLRDKANFDILEGFLSAILRQDVSVIKILESESNVPDIDLKLNRVDILIQDKQQRYVIIEVQNCHISAYLERLLFGVSKVIVDNVKSGEDYSEISKVISISILYFNLGLGKGYVFYGNTEFRGLYDNEPLVFRRRQKDKTLEKLKSQDIFPEYYLINVERFADEMETDLDEWIYLFKHAALPPNCKAKNLDKAGKKLDVLKMKPEERHRYDMYLNAMVNERDKIETALKDGRQEGRQEGLQEGLQKGRQEGKIDGKLEVAKEMQKSGMDIETIAAMTGLSPSEITG
ncbi:Rpn family recombination-promoting nuclease/putative transposase [Candidatus Parabeggiatoa sp. HSG14]|uniref:Rpn family recombination-promoting nuclease/putative transposase n=1 Tax=Candidatus Parabeggiatoa sp. HSG14 TaxID=3055593 RepID=UPI0025A6A324|nr:Rpn family recombination-promoting nuclease/putative transposase [Thiotrichales bacterium HSG14]